MPFLRRNILGLAFEERAALAAEVAKGRGGAVLRRAGEFRFPGGLSLETPDALGAALRAFLRERGFAAADVVIGLPARWLLARERTFPPASPDALAGMVRIEIERCFAADASRLATDFVPAPMGEQGWRALMLAAPKSKTDALLAIARAARLRPIALMPTAMAFAAPSGMTLALRPAHCEAALRPGGEWRGLRHLAATPADGASLLNELRRIAAAGPAPESLAIWNGFASEAGALKSLGEGLGVPCRVVSGLEAVGVRAAEGMEREGETCAPAAALAVSRLRGGSLAADFLHSRLAVRGPGISRRKTAWAAAAAVAVAVAAAMLAGDWRAQERELAELRQRIEAMKPDIRSAQDLVERATLLRQWVERRPRFLDPLREITLALPAEGRLWITSLAVREDMRVALTGKASDERTVLSALDRIQGNAAFDDVKLLYIRQASGGSRDVAFSMTFAFKNRE